MMRKEKKNKTQTVYYINSSHVTIIRHIYASKRDVIFYLSRV